MAMNMEESDIRLIESCIEGLRSVKAPLTRGIDNTMEVAKETGSANFIKSVGNLQAVTPEFVEGILEQYCQRLEVVVSTYKSTAGALGNL